MVGVLIFLLVVGTFYFIDTTFRINTITVLPSRDTIPVAGLPEIEGSYLFLTSEKSITDTIIRANPSIQNVEVIKKFPNAVELRVTRYKPVAYFKSVDGYFQLANEAHILGKSRDIDKKVLPIITYYQVIPFAQYQAGQQLPAQDIRDSIFFMQKLQEMGIRINSIDIAGFHMLGLYTENKKYYFSSEKERNIQIYHVEQAIKRFKTEKTEYKTIDVRFDKPVITF